MKKTANEIRIHPNLADHLWLITASTLPTITLEYFDELREQINPDNLTRKEYMDLTNLIMHSVTRNLTEKEIWNLKILLETAKANYLFSQIITSTACACEQIIDKKPS